MSKVLEIKKSVDEIQEELEARPELLELMKTVKGMDKGNLKKLAEQIEKFNSLKEGTQNGLRKLYKDTKDIDKVNKLIDLYSSPDFPDNWGYIVRDGWIDKINEILNEQKEDHTAERNYRHELFNSLSTIEDANLKIEYARFLIGDWLEDYSFRENPDPNLALKWLHTISEKPYCERPAEEGQQSAKWFMEYDRIFKIVNIAFDYIVDAHNILIKAKEEGFKELKQQAEKSTKGA